MFLLKNLLQPKLDKLEGKSQYNVVSLWIKKKTFSLKIYSFLPVLKYFFSYSRPDIPVVMLFFSIASRSNI